MRKQQYSLHIINNYIINIIYFSDIKSVKDSKHHFEKVSIELDSALLRNSQVGGL